LTYFSRLLTDNDRTIGLFFSSFDGQRQTHWPIFLVYWRTTTDPLPYLSRLLANNDRPIDLFFSSIEGQRQTHWPIYLVYWRTTTEPLTYLYRLLTDNVNMHWPIFSPHLDTVVRKFRWHRFYYLTKVPRYDKIHDRFLTKLFSIDLAIYIRVEFFSFI